MKIGEIVHYMSTDGDCLAAVITAKEAVPGLMGLSMILPNGIVFLPNVEHDVGLADGEPSLEENTWHNREDCPS